MKVIREINRRNILLKHKFHDDERFVRVYKRIDEANGKRKMYEPFIISKVETDRVDALNKIREQVDDILYHDSNAIRNEGYFSGLVMSRVSNTLKTMNLVSMNIPAATITQTMHDMQEIHRLIVMEYTNQYKQYKFKTA